MAESFPKPQAIVIATAKKVYEHGAYFALDEYGGIEAYMPIGEISSSRVSDIKDVIKEGKRYVCKVIRVDPYRAHIDISLKRVTDQERKQKMIIWKRNQRAEKLIEILASKIKSEKKEILNELSNYIGEEFEDLLSIFERPIKEGKEVLESLNLKKELKEAIYEVAKEHIKIPIPEVKAEFSLFTYSKGGVYLIKNAIEQANKSIEAMKNLREVEITYLGSSRFFLRIKAGNFKIAEEAIKKFELEMQNAAKNLNLQFSFKRL